MRHGREFWRLDHGQRRRDARNRDLGQCRLRLSRRRPARHVRDRGPRQGARCGDRRASELLRHLGLQPPQIQGEKPEDIEKTIIYQIGALQGVARALGHRVGHVKAHGTLANLAALDRPTALAIGRAVAALDPRLIYVVMAGTELERAAAELGLPMAREIMPTAPMTTAATSSRANCRGRSYTTPGRRPSGCWRWVREGAIISASGKRIPVAIDTVCVHGDNPAAVAMAAEVRNRLEQAGIAVRPMTGTRN